MSMEHQSVLLKESIDSLELKEGDVFVDATVGRGGHSEYVAQKFGRKIRVIGIDADPNSIEASKKRLGQYDCDFVAVQENFRNIDLVLKNLGLEKIDKILFDLGWNTNQFEEGGKGFSFQRDEPLNMFYGDKPDFTAGDIVNTWEEGSIANVLFGYGEEKYARRIAKAIVEKRKQQKIETTGELAKVITESVPFFYRKGKINPATKSFQALRIAVNDELGALRAVLYKARDVLAVHGRIAVIAFHSLEDRIVKNFFNELRVGGEWQKINKKPIIPSREEILENPRSRSAKLRIIEKIS